MKIYFSEASIEDIESFGDEGTFVVFDTTGDKRFFYNGVEHGTNPGGVDEVRIFDGCNRSIPLAVETIPALIAALNECYANHNIMQEAVRVQDAVESRIKFFVTGEEDFPYVENTAG